MLCQRGTPKFQADITLPASNSNREKECPFSDNSRKKKVLKKTDCSGSDHSLISEPNTWTGSSGQDWVMLPISVVRECGLIEQTIWRRSPQKSSMTIKKWERKPCLAMNKICSYHVLVKGGKNLAGGHSAGTHSHLNRLQIPFTPTFEKKGRNRQSNYLTREGWC